MIHPNKNLTTDPIRRQIKPLLPSLDPTLSQFNQSSIIQTLQNPCDVILPSKLKTKTNSVALVRERTIPNERQPLVGEVSANFCGQRVLRGQYNRSLQPYSRPSKLKFPKWSVQFMAKILYGFLISLMKTKLSSYLMLSPNLLILAIFLYSPVSSCLFGPN
jgi:hypothetical protein